MQNIHQSNMPKSFSITEEPDENEMTDRNDQVAYSTEGKQYEVPTYAGLPVRVNIRIEEPLISSKKPSISST